MNLSLIDPFVLAQDYPDALTGNLRESDFALQVAALTGKPGSGHATCIRFNRRGDFLAAGRVRSLPPLGDMTEMVAGRRHHRHFRCGNQRRSLQAPGTHTADPVSQVCQPSSPSPIPSIDIF